MTATLDIYCRISQDYDGTLRSVESQEEDCRYAIAESGGWELGKVFRDHAKSAWKLKVARPEFEQMMARLESREADGVMVYDLTRFTRKPMEGERLLDMAAQGIVVASITTTYNLRTADGRKQFRDAMTAAAFESDKISDRTRRRMRKKAARGRSNATLRGSPARVPPQPSRLGARRRTHPRPRGAAPSRGRGSAGRGGAPPQGRAGIEDRRGVERGWAAHRQGLRVGHRRDEADVGQPRRWPGSPPARPTRTRTGAGSRSAPSPASHPSTA